MQSLSEQGWLPEWPNGADCKSAGYAFGGSNPSPPTDKKGGKETRQFLSAFLSSCRFVADCRTIETCLENVSISVVKCIGMSKCLVLISLICETGHIALRNGPFRSLKRPVLHCKMGRFATHCVPVRYVGGYGCGKMSVCIGKNVGMYVEMCRYIWGNVSVYIMRCVGMYGKTLWAIKKTVFSFGDSEKILYLCNIKMILNHDDIKKFSDCGLRQWRMRVGMDAKAGASVACRR